MVFLAVGFAQDVQKPGQISPACDPTADVWSFK